VLSATTPERFASPRRALRRLARSAPLWIAGAGAGPEVGVPLLDVDPLAAAARIADAG
jgi:hypothetical protein